MNVSPGDCSRNDFSGTFSKCSWPAGGGAPDRETQSECCGRGHLSEEAGGRKEGETQVSPCWDPARMPVSWEPGPRQPGLGCTYVCECLKLDPWLAQQPLTRQLITSRSNPTCQALGEGNTLQALLNTQHILKRYAADS